VAQVFNRPDALSVFKPMVLINPVVGKYMALCYDSMVIVL